MRSKETSGVSLIELMVVMGILVLVLGSVVMAFASGILVWDTARNFDSARIDAMLFLEDMEREIRNSHAFYGVPFEGARERLTLAATRGQREDEQPGLYRIVFSYDTLDAAVVKTVLRFPSARGEKVQLDRRLPGVSRLRFEYAYADPELPGYELAWAQAWPLGKATSGRIPSAVRISMDVGEGDQLVSIVRTVLIRREDPVEEDDEDEEST